MKFITTHMHGIEYYLMVVLLLVGLALFKFTDPTATLSFRVVGIVLLLLLMTRYELGLVKAIPMKGHIAADALTSLFLIAAPWMFDFVDHATPFVIIGLVIMLTGIFTQTVSSQTILIGESTW